MNVCYILTTNTVTEFVKYVNVIGPEAVRRSPVTSVTLTDITTFWKAHQTDCRDCQDWHRCTFFQLQVLMRSVCFQSTISY